MPTNTGPDRGSGAVRELADDPASRKRFLTMAGAGVAGGLAVLISACGGKDKSSTTAATPAAGSPSGGATPGSGSAKGDLEIVNYALTLEYLEADFYQQVLDSGLVKDKKLGDLAKRIHQNEQDHVDALTQTVKKLGGTPATKPKTAFESVLKSGLAKILGTAATVENLGAAAYLGQAGRIKSKEILAAALSIHSVEARHAAALNSLVKRGFKGAAPLEGSIPDGPFAKPMSMDEVLAAVKPFIAG